MRAHKGLGDGFQAGTGGGGVDRGDEVVDVLARDEALGVVVLVIAGGRDEAGEDMRLVPGQAFGQSEVLGDGFDDPPVLTWLVRPALRQGGGDGWCPEVLGERAAPDLLDHWWTVGIRGLQYSP
ncbi:hypothetical protein OG535_39060 [Kitasatospora sp. NBC_00085]|uniref:hypothetical protein n=1 Tax=unclassified Kitasatospora TaxID=2633591 RepID=UPI003253D2BA